jgi:hypothetical protein
MLVARDGSAISSRVADGASLADAALYHVACYEADKSQ